MKPLNSSQRKSENYATKVQAEIRSALADGRSIGSKDIALRVGLSLRTMQRRLSDECMTFSSLLDVERMTIVNKLLKTNSVAGAAKALGFSDRNCLLVAYKRWFGVTPRQKQCKSKGVSNV